jgi:serine/threonine protein phosphatase PrpC
MPQPTPTVLGHGAESSTVLLPPAVPAATVRTAGLTDPGRVRASNEDHFLIAELGRMLWVRDSSLPQQPTQAGRQRSHLLLVADGMGGHQAGEVASALTVTTMEDFVLHVLRQVCHLEATDEQAVLRDLKTAVQQADDRILAEAAHHAELAGMGTTLTLAFVSGSTLFAVHAGDSRAYVLREGGLHRLTEDHTVAAELARRGLIRSEEVRRHRLRHMLTNVLGGGQVGVQVDVQRFDLQAGDVLLLCTDGLTDMVRDEQIAAILVAEHEPMSACRRLVAAANEQGGKDNITVVVAQFAA